MFYKVALVFFFSLMLSACPSSGGSDNSPQQNNKDQEIDLKAIYNAKEVKDYDVNYNEAKWR